MQYSNAIPNFAMIQIPNYTKHYIMMQDSQKYGYIQLHIILQEFTYFSAGKPHSEAASELFILLYTIIICCSYLVVHVYLLCNGTFSGQIRTVCQDSDQPGNLYLSAWIIPKSNVCCSITLRIIWMFMIQYYCHVFLHIISMPQITEHYPQSLLFYKSYFQEQKHQEYIKLLLTLVTCYTTVIQVGLGFYSANEGSSYTASSCYLHHYRLLPYLQIQWIILNTKHVSILHKLHIYLQHLSPNTDGILLAAAYPFQKPTATCCMDLCLFHFLTIKFCFLGITLDSIGFTSSQIPSFVLRSLRNCSRRIHIFTTCYFTIHSFRSMIFFFYIGPCTNNDTVHLQADQGFQSSQVIITMLKQLKAYISATLHLDCKSPYSVPQLFCYC